MWTKRSKMLAPLTDLVGECGQTKVTKGKGVYQGSMLIHAPSKSKGNGQSNRQSNRPKLCNEQKGMAERLPLPK